jgi:hypothetical protein
MQSVILIMRKTKMDSDVYTFKKEIKLQYIETPNKIYTFRKPLLIKVYEDKGYMAADGILDDLIVCRGYHESWQVAVSEAKHELTLIYEKHLPELQYSDEKTIIDYLTDFGKCFKKISDNMLNIEDKLICRSCDNYDNVKCEMFKVNTLELWKNRIDFSYCRYYHKSALANF